MKQGSYQNVAQWQILILLFLYNELIKGEHPEFISFSVKKILDNCDIMIAPKGIGWIVIK